MRARGRAALVAGLVALLGASAAFSGSAARAAGPGYVATIQFSYDSPLFPETRYRVALTLSGEVCGDPFSEPWTFVGRRTGGPNEPPPTLSTVTFAAANPAPITSDRWLDGAGTEVARIEFLLRMTPGTPPVLTAEAQVTGDILNVVATPPQVAATRQTLADCPAVQPPAPPPPPPPPAGTPVGGPAAGYPLGKVKLPGARAFSQITAGQALRPGTMIDVSNGAGVSLTDGRQGRLTIFGQRDGVPSIVKLVRVAGLVELQLTGSLKSCGKRMVAAAEKPIRRIWANGKGKFRTRGRFALATIRGTRWLTVDFCDRTLVHAAQGSLRVRDFVTKKNVVVKAPNTYSARPKR